MRSEIAKKISEETSPEGKKDFKNLHDSILSFKEKFKVSDGKVKETDMIYYIMNYVSITCAHERFTVRVEHFLDVIKFYEKYNYIVNPSSQGVQLVLITKDGPMSVSVMGNEVSYNDNLEVIVNYEDWKYLVTKYEHRFKHTKFGL